MKERKIYVDMMDYPGLIFEVIEEKIPDLHNGKYVDFISGLEIKLPGPIENNMKYVRVDAEISSKLEMKDHFVFNKSMEFKITHFYTSLTAEEKRIIEHMIMSYYKNNGV